jgi:hypothetical protein
MYAALVNGIHETLEQQNGTHMMSLLDEAFVVSTSTEQ